MDEEGTCIFCDKSGCTFEVRGLSREDVTALLAMYETFYPKPSSQGLPPSQPEACRKWVIGLSQRATNIIACREGRIVGHMALIPDYEKGDCEFLIFVDQPTRNLGIGGKLARQGLVKAKELGLKSVWLTVETYNFRAIRLYKSMGFTFCTQDECERAMILWL